MDDWLKQVAELHAAGKNPKAIATQLGIVPSSLTYQLARRGYETKRVIVDQRTGTPLTEILAEIDGATEAAAR